METLLQARDLFFGWDRSQEDWFQSMNLSFEGGHLYGLLGRNGAGKTTFIKLLCGLLRPHSGASLWNDGRGTFLPMAERPPEALADVMFVPETAELPNVPAEEFGRLAGSLYPRYDHAKFFSHLSAFEVPVRSRIGALSFGQKRKVHISFALASGARLLFLDEPTNGLDVAAQVVLRRLLIDHLSEAKAVVVSTHHVREFETVLDSVMVLERGRLLFKARLEDLQADPSYVDLEHWYLRLIGLPPTELPARREKHDIL